MAEQIGERNHGIGRKELLGAGAKAAAVVAGGAAGLGQLGQVAQAARIEARETAAPVKLLWEVEFTDTPDQQAVTTYLIKPYERLHPNVSISLRAPGSSSNIDKDLETQFAAGAGPDMYDGNGPSYVPPYIKAGDAANLESYAKKYGWRQKLTSFALESSLYQGKLYSLPTEFESLYLWYNKTLMKKYGWKVPTTYDELLTVCKAIQDKGLIPFMNGFNAFPGGWDWWYSYFLNAYLGSKKLYRVLTGQVPWTDPEIATSFNMMKRLWDLGYITKKQATAITDLESWALWGQQKGVFKLEGTWGFQPGLVYASAKNFEWDIAPLPIWKPGVDYYPPLGIGEINAINPHSKNAAVVADFYDFAFFRNRAQILKWLPKLSSIFTPPLHWTAEDFKTGFDPRLSKTLVELSSAQQTGRFGYLSWSAWPAKTEAYMWGNFESLLYNRMKVSDYLKHVQQVFQSEKAAGQLPVVPKPVGI